MKQKLQSLLLSIKHIDLLENTNQIHMAVKKIEERRRKKNKKTWSNK